MVLSFSDAKSELRMKVFGGVFWFAFVEVLMKRIIWLTINVVQKYFVFVSSYCVILILHIKFEIDQKNWHIVI